MATYHAEQNQALHQIEENLDYYLVKKLVAFFWTDFIPSPSVGAKGLLRLESEIKNTLMQG